MRMIVTGSAGVFILKTGIYESYFREQTGSGIEVELL